MAAFELTAATMAGLKYHGKVSKLIVRAAGGDLCILPSHTDFATPLGRGRAKIVTEDGSEIFAKCEGGFLSVQKDKTSIIASKFEIE